MTQIVDLMKHTEPHVSVPELAAYWHVSERTVYRLIDKGALVGIRIGRVLRVRIDDARSFGRIEDPVTAPITSAN